MDILRISTLSIIFLSTGYIISDRMLHTKHLPAPANTINLNEYTLTNDKQQEMMKQDMAIVVFEKKPITYGLVFRIQILASDQPIAMDDKRFMGCPDVNEYFADGKYHYTVGTFYTPDQSNTMFEELNNMGYRDAFMVAFKDDKPIPVKQAMYMLRR